MSEESNRTISPGLVALFLFGSGFCALVYQTVWLRELRDVFGASTAATAAVVGIFMAGLGTGGLRFGRVADQSDNPLNLYSMLELGVTLSAFASIPLLILVRTIYYGTGGSMSLGIGGASFLRLLLAVLLLGIPTFLMGGTLPAAARAIVGRDDVRRRGIAMLYGVNTLGAVAGALSSTFFALEMFGNQKTLILACLMNAIVVVVSRAHARNAGSKEAEAEDETHPVSEVQDENHVEAPGRLVLTAAVVTGFVFMLMEMVWYRVLAPVLGGSTFTFGLILATALAGIGLGGLAYSLLESRQPATMRLFGLTCAAEALAIAIPYALGDRIALFAAFLLPMEAFGFGGRITAWAMISCVVVAPASAVAGFQFPLLIALAGRARRNVGVDVGRVYAFNTLGGIAGSLGGGFGLMPLLTAEGCWVLSVWVMLALAAVFAVGAFRRRQRAWGAATVATLTAVIIASSVGPTAVWRHSPIGAGRVKMRFQTKAELQDWERGIRRSVVWEREGVESAVAVVGDRGYAFAINGKIDGHSVGDAGTQIMGGLIGAIQHEAPNTSLVIGLGTGSTAGWLASVPGMEQVDVAELEPAVVDVARYCAPVNRNVLESENVRILVGDAREILLTGDSRYDLIFSEPSNPYRAGIASLFTREFYTSAQSRLNDDGMFMQWVQGYEITPQTLETILVTLQHVFPYVQIWQTLPEDVVLVASSSPIPVRVDLIRERMTQQPYKDALSAAWRVHSFEEFAAHYISDQRLIERAILARDVDINTDDRNLVEFGFARSVGRSLRTRLVDLARRYGDSALPAANVDPARLSRLKITSSTLEPAEPDQNNTLYLAVNAYKNLNYAAVVSLWAATGLEPETHSETLLVAHSLAQAGGERCYQYADALARFSETESSLVRALCMAARGEGDPADIGHRFATALRAHRDDPWIDVELVKSSLKAIEIVSPTFSDETLSELSDALAEPFAVSMANDMRNSVLLKVSRLVEHDRCGDRTIRALHALEPWTPWNEEVLRIRSQCYAATGDPRALIAKRDYVAHQLDEMEPLGGVDPEGFALEGRDEGMDPAQR